MSATSTLKRHTSPIRAAHYFSGPLQRRGAQGDEVPAMLWLWLAIIALIQIRRGSAWPPSVTFPQAMTYVVVGGLIILAGRFVPRIVLLVLVGILVAGVLDAAPAVSGILGTLEAQIAALPNPIRTRGGPP